MIVKLIAGKVQAAEECGPFVTRAAQQFVEDIKQLQGFLARSTDGDRILTTSQRVLNLT